MFNTSSRGRGLRLCCTATASIFALAASPAMAKDCAEMAGLALPHGKVTAATVVPAGGFSLPPNPFGPPPGVAAATFKALPEFCRVQATLSPTPDSDIKVEIWLPAKGWNGKFVGIGNGIWAGSISFFEMGRPIGQGYAVAATDTGHTGNGLTADFAVGHPEKLVDFGHRAVHEMTVAAKQAIAAFYGEKPKLSYWNSCSTGGRQGLMAAYRYLDDFDAISAMAPANPMTNLMTQSLWTGFQAVRKPGAGLNPAKLGVLHKAYVNACDAKDGLKDGIVSRPNMCKFDPAVALCKPGQSGDSCLTGDQVETMRAIYGGVKDSRTGKLAFPGFPPGSEMQLGLLISGPEPFPVATSYMRQLVFADPKWDFRSFDYGADLDRARKFGETILDVPANGLKPFFARGGKLLLSHGWHDGLIPANNTLTFYGKLQADLPRSQADAQLRLFMAPGMDHCSGGEGFSVFDTLGTIDRWATENKAPEQIIASRAPNLPPMSRPLCPYPKVARYKGKGDQNAAENFTCAAR